MAPKRNKTEAIYRSRYITRQTRSQSQATQEQRDNFEDDELTVHDEDEEAVPGEAVHDGVEESVLAAGQLPSSFDTPRSGDDGYTSTSSPEVDGNAEISVIDILDEETDSDDPRLGANDIVGSPVSLSIAFPNTSGFMRAHREVGSSRIGALRSYRVVGNNSAASSSNSQSTESNSTARPRIWDMTVDLTSPRRSTIYPVLDEANHVAVTPPRTPTILDETVDLTDSPMATPDTVAPPTSTSASPPTAASLPPATASSSGTVASSPSAASSPTVTSSDTNVGAPLIRCPVCLDDLPRIRFAQKTVMSTLCGHVFCSSCLPVCIQSTGRCPTCRRFLHFRDMHPIFI